jgi:Protein of unknown function (DUF3800)
MSAPIRVSDWIGEYCLALAHRWNPERLVVILTAYFDESGTHGDSPVTVMAGVMANATQWSRFQTEFSALKAKYNFRVLHAKKFKRRAGDFKGRNVLDQLALLTDLAKLSEGPIFRECVTFTLDNAEYEALLKGGEKPRRLRIPSRYGLCFRNCLLHFILHTVKHSDDFISAPKLHFVLESGHRNWAEVRDIFKEVKEEIKSITASIDLLGDITFADKNSCDPLMMADFLAHYAWLMASGQMGPAPTAQPYLEPDTTVLPEGESGVTHMRFEPGGMATLKSALIEKLQTKKASAKPPSSGEQSS